MTMVPDSVIGANKGGAISDEAKTGTTAESTDPYSCLVEIYDDVSDSVIGANKGVLSQTKNR